VNGTIFERSAPLFRVFFDTGVLVEHGAGSAMTSDAVLDPVVGPRLVVVGVDCFPPPLEQPATRSTNIAAIEPRARRLANITLIMTPTETARFPTPPQPQCS